MTEIEVKPLVTVVVPSFQQGRYLDEALASIFAQGVPVECYVMDGGSTDGTLGVIEKWAPQLAGWRSSPDRGQSAAINEGVALGAAPYVAWLNSDDFYLLGGLRALLDALESHPSAPAAYGRVFDLDDHSGRQSPVWVEPFSARRLAIRCIISQPGTLIRRSVWSQLGGVDESLSMAMDYDLWWRVYKGFGSLAFVEQTCAVNRQHNTTKTNSKRRLHYREAMAIVRKYHGNLPLKWWLHYPYSVWYKQALNSISNFSTNDFRNVR